MRFFVYDVAGSFILVKLAFQADLHIERAFCALNYLSAKEVWAARRGLIVSANLRVALKSARP